MLPLGPSFLPPLCHHACMTDCEEESKVRMVCKRCGSEEVTRDAWAEWDVEAQMWHAAAVFDHAYCHRCQSDASIAELPLV